VSARKFRVDNYIAGMIRGKKAAKRRPMKAKSLVEDFAFSALERERDRYKTSVQNKVRGAVDDSHVKTEAGAVVVLKCYRHSGCDCERQKVSVTIIAESKVELERCSSKPGDQYVEMEQALVINLSLNLGSISQDSHKTSPTGSGSAAATADAPKGTVGEAVGGVSGPPGAPSTTTEGGIA
jgi:hypothetical protein